MKRLPFSLMLTLALLATLAPVAPSQQRKKKPTPQTSLNKKLDTVRQRQENVRKELQKTKVQTQWVVQDIDRVDQRLTVVQEKLEQTTERLGQSRQTQKQIASELVSTTHKLDATREQLRRRLRAIYEEGDSGYWTILAGMQSVGDLAVRADHLQSIAEQDRRLFDQYAALRNQLSIQKRKQDQVVKEIGNLATSQRNQQVELKDVRNDKTAALQSLRAKQSQLSAMLKQFEADERQIQNEIAAYIRRMAELRRQAAMKKVQRNGKTVYVNQYPELIFSGRFSRPISGPVTSGYGVRYHPILKVRRPHTGVDFGAGHGAPILAAAEGYVISATYMRGYGNTVIIDHGSGLSTVYAHASRIYVQSGQKVSRGQRIAAVGSTGLSTGPHLHFEVRRNGVPVNPVGRL